MTGQYSVALTAAFASYGLSVLGFNWVALGAALSALVIVVYRVTNALTADTNADVDVSEQHGAVVLASVGSIGMRYAPEGPEAWCDYCQREFEDGPDWRVEGDRVTGYFCREECAESWAGDGESIQAVGQHEPEDGDADA